MKKLLYLCTYDLSMKASMGVANKMQAQRKVFSKTFAVSYTYMKDGHFYIKDDNNQIDLGAVSFPGRITAIKLLQKYLQENEAPECVYIRYTMADWNVIRLLRWLHNEGAKIVIEIPTFPYEEECKDNLYDFGSLFIDHIYRNKMRKYVDYIASYGSIPLKIYGIPTISILNGIDIDSISERKPLEHGEKINLIAVAGMSKWHGYDRLLNGMADYYRSGGQNDIHLYLVGEGSAISQYEQIVQDGAIEEHVTFCGFKSGNELDDLYDICDIGVSSLGIHRIGIYGSMSVLKCREYGAKGLPMITSNEIDFFPSNENDFILKVSEDEESIDVNLIINFYHKMRNIYSSDLNLKIRTLTKDKCDMSITMIPVIQKM